MMDLFRQEALSHFGKRLEGNLIVIAPTSIRVIAWLCVITLLATTFYALTQSHQSVVEARGRLVSSNGLLKMSAPASGIIEHLYIHVGQRISAGQRMMTLRVDPQSVFLEAWHSKDSTLSSADRPMGHNDRLGMAPLFISVFAPISGHVAAALVRPGLVVKKGTNIAIIIPAHSKIVAQIWLSSRDIGFVKVGQYARINVSSYPHVLFGSCSGRVIDVLQIGINRPDPNSSGIAPRQPMFPVTVALTGQLSAYGRPARMIPGVLVSARIMTRKMPILDWIFNPLVATGHSNV